MIDLLSTMQVILQGAGFNTRLASVERFSTVCFEDDTLMGFGFVFDNAHELLMRWKTTEMSVLTRYAPSLRAAGDKAWNVYCLFLCGAAGDPLLNRQVRLIEEDLERTRKIAACGVSSRGDLVRALLPVLPLQHQPVLQTEDATERLQRRIRTIAPGASEVALDTGVSAEEVVRLLGAPT